MGLLVELAPQDGRVLAGGQSLVPIMAFRLARPAHLIDINRVAGLDRLDVQNGQLRIGARVRHAAFHRPVEDGPLGALLAEVVRHIAHYPIRLRGTFCGSLAHADPAAEWCLVAATLDGELVAVSRRGERHLPAREFFHGAMQTALLPDELLAEARLSLLPPGTRLRNATKGWTSMAMVPSGLRTAVDTVVRPRIITPSITRLGIGGAEAAPRRLAAAEAVLAGERPGEAMFRAAADAAAAAIDPLTDGQTDARYRRELVDAMVYRALTRAAAQETEA